MKLSKLYSNNDKKFKPVYFNEGFNVIIGKVKDPENRKKDSHNLGKTLLIHLIDFLLLKELKREHLFKKHSHLFEDFEFYLEILLNSGEYVTVRRSMKNNTKISLKQHKNKHQNFSGLDDESWDHLNLAINKAKKQLNKILNLTSIFPFEYRDGVSYFLRTQDDFSDVFQLYKFKGKHETWKPYLAKILGFNEQLINEKYNFDREIDDKKDEINLIKKESHSETGTEEYDRIKGLIEIKSSELTHLREQIDKFNFYTKELNLNRQLVDEVESKIAHFNKLLYTNNYEIGKIRDSLENKVDFDIEKAKKLFGEVSIYFPEKLLRSYEQLEEFNKKLYSERKTHLEETLKKLEEERKSIKESLKQKNLEREEMLSFLGGTDTFHKFKEYQNETIKIEREINELKTELANLDKKGKIEHELRELNIGREALVEKIKKQVNEGNETYSGIRNTFNEITKKILDKSAFIYIKPNEKGNLEFSASIVKGTMEETSEGKGFSYKKILCEIFDLAILKCYSNKDFFRFVYQDGALESLDDRKKLNLLELAEGYCNDYGLQYILTLIEDDLPRDREGKKYTFPEDEIIRELDDTGQHGRLFDMEEF